MLKTAYITKAAIFLPNDPISNDEMEEYLGKIKGLRSKSKALVLRNNKIHTRYYALDKNGKSTHTNLQLTVEAIRRLCADGFDINEMELLTCGSASPDQTIPAMSSMVHGALGIGPIDAVTPSGSCNAAMWGLNYAWMSIMTGKVKNAISTGTEKMSTWMMSKNFEEESKHLEALGQNPYVAFEKDFLRWMLSDGSAAVLVQDKPAENGISLKIDWIDIKSYANEVETCMYTGGVKDENGDIIPWREFEPNEWMNQSIFSLKQDSRLLEKNITRLGAVFLEDIMKRYDLNIEDITWFLPHISSYYFAGKIKESLQEIGVDIPDEIWFTNLDKIGNIGAASAFFMLEEVMRTKNLQKGQKILLMVPESARFSYTFAQFTVV